MRMLMPRSLTDKIADMLKRVEAIAKRGGTYATFGYSGDNDADLWSGVVSVDHLEWNAALAILTDEAMGYVVEPVPVDHTYAPLGTTQPQRPLHDPPRFVTLVRWAPEPDPRIPPSPPKRKPPPPFPPPQPPAVVPEVPELINVQDDVHNAPPADGATLPEVVPAATTPVVTPSDSGVSVTDGDDGAAG